MGPSLQCQATFGRQNIVVVVYDELKARALPASELLQEAVRAELRRQALLDETDAYLVELTDEVGEPTPEEIARGEAIARRLRVRSGSKRAS